MRRRNWRACRREVRPVTRFKWPDDNVIHRVMGRVLIAENDLRRGCLVLVAGPDFSSLVRFGIGCIWLDRNNVSFAVRF